MSGCLGTVELMSKPTGRESVYCGPKETYDTFLNGFYVLLPNSRLRGSKT